MAKKTLSNRLLRIVQPNQGTKNWFRKEIKKTINWFRESVIDDTILSLFYERPSTEIADDFPDWIPAWSTPVVDYEIVPIDEQVAKAFRGILDARLSYWERRMDKLYREADMVYAIRNRINEEMEDNPSYVVGRFANEMPKSAKRRFSALKAVSGGIADKFVLNMARDTTMGQRASLLACGLTNEFIDARWATKIKATNHIYAKTAHELPRVIHDCANLVTKISAEECIRLQKVLAESVQGKASKHRVIEVLQTFNNVSAKRAEGIALDQSNKLSFFIQSSNAQALGITKAQWIHIAGRWTYRPTHKKMNGQVFDLNTGIYDPAPEVRRFVLPSECPYCRCKARFILPKELLRNDE